MSIDPIQDPEIAERLKKLKAKYEAMGQDMPAYLDGLLFSNHTRYWDYLHLDTLLTLQKPNTDFPDEIVFIVYHQITELYFYLALHEIEQIAHNGRAVGPYGEDKGWKDKLDVDFFIARLQRINNYFESLTKSFGIMIHGMEKEQFLRFRMALLPASGFQSAQYRMIEIGCTDLVQLVSKAERARFLRQKNPAIEKMFAHIYWKAGATELATGKKTLTLKWFEDKYSEDLIEMAKDYHHKNLWAKYCALPKKTQQNKDLIKALRLLDLNVNIRWPLVHYKSAARYLQQDPQDIAATGGTNWQKYLPPRLQKRVFYPALWEDKELEGWGKETR